MTAFTKDQQKAMQHFVLNNENFNDESFYFFRNYKNLSLFEKMSFHESVCYILGIPPKKGNKALKRAFYTSFQEAIDTQDYYIPDADYLLVTLFQDPNHLTQLIRLPLSQKMKLLDQDLTAENQIYLFWIFLHNKLSEKSLFLLVMELCTQEKVDEIYRGLLILYQDHRILFDDKFITCKTSLSHLKQLWLELIHKSHSEKITYYYQEQDIKKEEYVEGLRFQLPCHSLELYAWAQKLDNCLLTYADKIPKQTLIYGVFKDEKLMYAVEVSQDQIIQMSGFKNQNIPKLDLSIIQTWHHLF